MIGMMADTKRLLVGLRATHKVVQEFGVRCSKRGLLQYGKTPRIEKRHRR